MAKAIFEAWEGSTSIPSGPNDIAIQAHFCVAGLPAEFSSAISVHFLINILDTPLDIKRKLSTAVRDEVFSSTRVSLDAGDILLPDMTRGQLI